MGGGEHVEARGGRAELLSPSCLIVPASQPLCWGTEWKGGPRVGPGRRGSLLRGTFGASQAGTLLLCPALLCSPSAGGFPPRRFDGAQTGPGVLPVCSCRWG